MRIDCVSGLVKRATNLFQGVSQDFEAFKETELMKQLTKEPGSRDAHHMELLTPLLDNLKFFKQASILEE